MKLLLVFLTYPRDGKTTYGLMKKTVESLGLQKLPSDLELQILVVGDDYPHMEELRPLFEGFRCEFVDKAVGCALRHSGAPREIIWAQAACRGLIWAYEQGLERFGDYDYIMISDDDEEYINDKIGTTVKYAKEYNYPDFIYSRGIYCGSTHLPHTYDSSNLLANPPRNSNAIASGCWYSLRNRVFIEDIIRFRKERWALVEQGLRTGNYGGVYAGDAEMWDHLGPLFKQGTFSCLLVPHLLIHHYSERSVYNYVK